MYPQSKYFLVLWFFKNHIQLQWHEMTENCKIEQRLKYITLYISKIKIHGSNSPPLSSSLNSTASQLMRTFWDLLITTLQMFCLQNTKMFICVLNSITNIGCIYMYLFVMDNKFFHVVFTLIRMLNSLKNKHILSNLQKNICCFNKLFSYWQNFLSFFAGYETWSWF